MLASTSGRKRRRESISEERGSQLKAPYGTGHGQAVDEIDPPFAVNQTAATPAGAENAVSPIADANVPFVTFEEDQDAVDTRRIPPIRSESTVASTQEVSLTSRELPPQLAADRPWTSLHLDTLLTQRQLDDVIHILSGSQEAALEFASILTAKRFGKLDASQKRKLQELRGLIWSPEDDEMVLSEIGRGAVPKQILDKHGYEAYKARVVYLADHATRFGRDELERPRFPFV
jgi:hypothetical protein